MSNLQSGSGDNFKKNLQMLKDNKENVAPSNKNLIGRKKSVHSSNSTGESTVDLTGGSRSSSFDKLLESMVTPAGNSCKIISQEQKENVNDTNAAINVNAVLNSTRESTVGLTASSRESRSSSFDKVLESMVTLESNSCKVISQELKENLHSPNTSINIKADAKSNNRSNSFELMMDSFLGPSCSSANNEKQKRKDLTFDELMNQILTPDLSAPSSSHSQTSQKSQPSINKIKNRKLIRETWKMQQPKKQPLAEKNNNTANSRQSHELDDDSSFEELLREMCIPDFNSQKAESGVNMIKERDISGKSGVNMIKERDISVTQTCVNENSKILPQKDSLSSCTTSAPTSSVSQAEKDGTSASQQLSSPGDADDESFEKMLMEMLTPEVSDSSQKAEISSEASSSQKVGTFSEASSSQKVETCIRKKTKCRESSTQTCFYDFSEPVLFEDIAPMRMNRRDRPVEPPLFFPQFFPNPEPLPYPEPLPVSESPHSDVTPATIEMCSLKIQEELSTDSSKHILDVLSRDITTLPDGRKIFNNISQIGTDKWLQSAFASVRNLVFNKKDKIQVIEEQNTSDLYIDYLTKKDLKRYINGNIKICEIYKTYSASTENDQTLVWGEATDLTGGTGVENKLRRGINEICKNEELIYSNYNLQKIDKNKIRIKIHSIFARLYDAFEGNRVPNIILGGNRCVMANGRLQPVNDSLKKLNFKNKQSRPKFNRVLYIMGKIYLLLQSGTKLTKREIFYQVKHVVGTQALLNSAIEEVTHLLGVGHWHLNIVSQSGLVYGNLKLIWASGETTDCNASATLIPNDMENIAEVQANAFFILVVEKESIFRKLIEEDLPNKLARPFIMMTGKGVPSVNTRLFLNTVSRMMALPVFIMVDADVYGIRIMLTYRFGAIKNCHLSDDLAVPNARWLGVFPSEIKRYGMPNQKLTKRDKSIIGSTLKNPCMKDNPKIAAELELLLMLNTKASIEGLIKSNTFLSESYLPMKLFNQDFM